MKINFSISEDNYYVQNYVWIYVTCCCFQYSLKVLLKFTILEFRILNKYHIHFCFFTLVDNIYT